MKFKADELTFFMIGSITTFVLSSIISQNLSLSALDGLSLEFFISLKLMIESVFLNAGKIYFLHQWVN